MTNQLRDLSRELDSDQLRTQAIVSIDSTSRIREGRDAEFWIDTRKIHCFDPASGDNLTRDAEAGAELTRQAIEDREADLAEKASGAGARDGAAPGRPRTVRRTRRRRRAASGCDRLTRGAAAGSGGARTWARRAGSC